MVEVIREICPELEADQLASIIETSAPVVPETPVVAAAADLEEILEDDMAAIDAIQEEAEPLSKEALSFQADLRNTAAKLRANTAAAPHHSPPLHWEGLAEQTWDPEASFFFWES